MAKYFLQQMKGIPKRNNDTIEKIQDLKVRHLWSTCMF